MSTKVISQTVEVIHERRVACSPLKNPLVFSLDVDTLEEARRFAKLTSDLVGGFKLGPRLVMRYGTPIIEEMAALAPVFVDCKFFDIPTIMVASVRAVFESGASLCTVHAMAGEEALLALGQLQVELNRIRPFKILCVTILTSWSEDSLPSVIAKGTIESHVVTLVDLAEKAGLSGIVCSAKELEALDDRGLYLVTPGIRFSDENVGDQKRVLSPSEAVEKGASAIVVGRPILEAKNPRDSAMDFLTAVFSRSVVVSEHQ